MGSGIALDDALIMSVVLEGILYGFSLLMFVGTIWVLTRDDGGYTRNRAAMIAVAIVLLVLSTGHMVVDIVRLDQGLVKYRNTFPGGPVAFFADISQWSYVAENSIYLLQTLVGDGVVIYRCYVVWKSFLIIIIPSLLWCSVAVTGVGSVYSVSQATVNSGNVFATGTSQWITGFFVSTLSTNLLSTGLLAYRIWSIERNVASIRASKSTLLPVLYVLIDAAVLYSATLFVTLICFVTANNGEYVVVNLIMPIISIAFYMVLIRIAIRRNSTTYYTTTTGAIASSQDTGHGLRPLQVHISQFSRTDANTSPRLASHDLDRGLRFKRASDNAGYDVVSQNIEKGFRPQGNSAIPPFDV